MKRNKSEKACMFYVSDYHFEMIGLLNIKKEVEENKKVVIITQNNLEETIKKLLSSINFIEKERINEIKWDNNNEEKYIIIEKAIKNKESISIYIKGEEKYIENENKKIEKILKNIPNEYQEGSLKITDCYDFSKIEKNSEEIMKNYDINLVTGKEIQI